MIVLDASVIVKWFFEYDITVYDAIYVALTEETGLDFITADRRLYKRVRELEFVNFIADL